ncbi:MAG: outer membrane beta-barrel protein [Bdellovibrio sp.]
MKKLFTIVLVCISSMAPWAQADVDYQLELGIRQQSGDAEAAGSTAKSQMGFQFGATAHLPLTGALHLRTGMLYTQRPLIVETAGDETKVSINYLDIPVALMYKFEEYVGVFAGVSLAMNIDKTNAEDVESPFIPVIIGTSFKFAPNLGATLYYEGGGKAADGLKDYRAVGANLLITFD